MKTEETKTLEKSIRKTTTKMCVYGCFEVTLGNCLGERVDYITYDTKGIWRCYEIKVSKADFYSSAKHSFVGHYNYFVMPSQVYEVVKQDIPDFVGVYVGGVCIKRPKKQELQINESILKDNMIRSLYRDSAKLYQTESETVLNKLNCEIANLKLEKLNFERKYFDLRNAVRDTFGREVLNENISGDE